MSTQPSLMDSSDRITDVDIADRMERSFLDYSMSVIVGRALPDVRDGLKPVQRRILYAMWEAGLRPGNPPRKCSSVIGDVMKKYHPHGDTSIYDTLVRLAQEFTTREPLVDGRGNFGSVDGDSAAAHRYTEALLSPVAMALLESIDEDTVDFVDNYDGYEREPVVLPARLPNLLINGSTGIAVGMATNIPPHNLGEIIDACLLLLDEPDSDLDALMRLVPAPDFPTGGRIVGGEGIRAAYETGRGAITMEAVATTETRSGGMPRIVVTEIPYQVNKAAMLEKMAGLVKDRKLDEIRDLRDESSRDGMRVVIELKRGEDPASVLAKLYEKTDLRGNFNVNLVALVDGTPRTLGLRDCLIHYLEHQRKVITRRTQFRRARAAERAHILEGLLVALDNLDDVIALIRAAKSADVARGQLMERYELTELQATAILDMQLRRLAQLERNKIAAEHRELMTLIGQLDDILDNPDRRDALLAEELSALKAEHDNPRRSRLLDDDRSKAVDGEPDLPPLLDAQQVTVYVTRGGWLKSVPQRPTSAPHSTPNDPLAAVLRATTEDTLLLVDAYGGGYRVEMADIPVTTMRQRGVSLDEVLGDPSAAAIIGAVRLDGSRESVVTVSARGLVKRSERSEYEGRTRAMIAAGIRDDDELVAVLACNEDDGLLLAHDQGLAIRFAASDVRLMGRSATGVAGMTLADNGAVVAATVVRDGSTDVLTLEADGGCKRTPMEDFPVQGRGGKGVQMGAGALAWCGVASDVHYISAGESQVLRPGEAHVAKRTGKFTSRVSVPDGPVVAEVR